MNRSLEKIVEQQKLKDQVIIERSEKGLTITLRGALFFDTGSVDLKPEAGDLIQKIIPAITAQKNSFGILVEGHTDDVPVKSKGLILSNWELSSLRACKILHIFEVAGFARDKMKALGWGDTRPVLPNRDPAGVSLPTNQAQNRRVVIKILKSEGPFND